MADEQSYRDAHDQGWDDGLDALWSSRVCSVCGRDHDRDESAACEGCEPVTFREWVEAIPVERDRYRDALDATYDDVMVLLDQHVSAEVAKEARHRLIERMAAGPKEGEDG